jgi:hypothetical protein
LNEHPTDGNEDPASDDEQQSQRRGLSSHCKKVIEKLIYSKNLTRPKLLHIQLTMKAVKYKIREVPTLCQIQQYTDISIFLLLKFINLNF